MSKDRFMGSKQKVARSINLEKEYGFCEREKPRKSAMVAFAHKPYTNDLKDMEDLYDDFD